MFSAFALLWATSGVQAVQPVDFRSFLDKPFRSRPDGTNSSGTVSYDVTVDRKGIAIHCDVASSSGSTAIDSETCYGIIKHIKFHPAADDRGLPQYGVFRQVWTWRDGIANPAPTTPSPDLVVTVNKMPLPGMKLDEIEADLVVDQNGGVESCSPLPSPGLMPYPAGDMRRLNEARKPLVDITCKELQSSWKPHVVRDENGVPVRSVQRAIVAYGLN